MKNSKLFNTLIIFTLIIFSSCSPRVVKTITNTYDSLAVDEEVFVLPLLEEIPESAEVLGQVKVGDAGMTVDCGYTRMIEELKTEARKVGGNGLKIIIHKTPDMASSCHRITAKVLRLENLEDLGPEIKEEKLDVDYVTLHFYRFAGMGTAVNYKVYVDDEEVCQVRNNFKKSIQIKKEGDIVILAKTEAKETLPIKVELGREYYIRCSVGMGVFVGQPKLELVDWKNGKMEFESFVAKNK